MVYVDDWACERTVFFRKEEKSPPRAARGRWFNIFADTADELVRFSSLLAAGRGVGILRELKSARGRFRIEVTARKRARAVRLGAEPIAFGSDFWMSLAKGKGRATAGRTWGESMAVPELRSGYKTAPSRPKIGVEKVIDAAGREADSVLAAVAVAAGSVVVPAIRLGP